TAIAYFLSESGLKDITLIEKEKLLGTAVTQYCSGGVRHQFTTPINCLFSIESMKTFNALAREIDYKKYGYLILDIQKGATEPRVKMQNDLGIKSEVLNIDQIKERFPFINTKGVISGSLYKEDGIADPSMLLAYYERKAKQNSVKFLMETKVTKLIKEDEGIRGIMTDKGEMKTDRVILAAGVQSKELGQTVGLNIPIVDMRKYVFQIEGFDFDFPLVMEVPTSWYIKKEGKDALIGMSGKKEKIDYEKQEESMTETIEASINRIPEIEKKGIKKTLSSLSDETPDKHAIIDIPLPGLLIATGFSGHGFMHSPATGKIAASLVKGEKPVIDISKLKLKRSHIKETIAI
ncbi:MAG: FAD-binding oxidoreductase, partial [Candidatus Margulisiibacteriota bacterium]